MLPSRPHKAMKALLILLAAAWQTQLLRVSGAPGLANKRLVSTYLHAAVRPATDDASVLVLPEVSADTMDIFLDRFTACLAQNIHAMVLDQAGWHSEKALAVPV